MAFNITSSWRGVVGCIKPTFRPGNLEEFIRLLPAGIGVFPLWVGNPPKGSSGSTVEDLLGERMEKARQLVAQLAELKVDLIHIEGGPLLMVHGYQAAEEILSGLEKKHAIPVFSTGQSQVAALRALGIKRIVAATYLREDVTQKCAQYIREAGFEVLCFETIQSIGVKHAEVGRLDSKNVYSFIKQIYLKHQDQDIQGIYLFGSGWPVLDIVQILEQDLQVPVIQAVAARIWDIQKRLHIREPIKGYGRLLEELP